MLKVRVMADLPADARPRLEVRDARGSAFQAEVDALKREKGAAFTVCDVGIASRLR
jgi:peptidylprolyl isomerase